MPVDRQRLKGLYGRLKGIQAALGAQRGTCYGTMGNDFNSIVKETGAVLEEDSSAFLVPQHAFYRGGGDRHDEYMHEEELGNKLNQILSYLEYTQHVGAEVVEIGTLFNSIHDETLRARCSDLLSAPGNFDRVVNQATLGSEPKLVLAMIDWG